MQTNEKAITVSKHGILECQRVDISAGSALAESIFWTNFRSSSRRDLMANDNLSISTGSRAACNKSSAVLFFRLSLRIDDLKTASGLFKLKV